MRPLTLRHSTYLLAASLGSLVFWSALQDVHPMRPGGPHPGLKDSALKQALKSDHDRAHQTLSYIQARKLLFSSVDGDGRKSACRYTGTELRYMLQPLPNKAAVEHAQPLTRLPAEARSDLHHMFVVTPEARLARLNLYYGEVVVAVWAEGGSRSGPSKRVVPAFEVRREARGDIARAIFHVSTMYDTPLPEHEERVLRAWHKQDPVSKEEKRRNDTVASHQGSRNPFIDHPVLTARIEDF